MTDEQLFADVSAHTGEGVDSLLDAVLLQAELMDLKASPGLTIRPSGFGPYQEVTGRGGCPCRGRSPTRPDGARVKPRARTATGKCPTGGS